MQIHHKLRGFLSGGIVLFAAAALAADVPEFPGPEPEHAFLKRFVGEWTTTSECRMGPDQPPEASTGVIKSRMLGEFWVINDLRMTGGGMQMQGVQTIGYDPAQDKYVGTWVDSVMNHLWKYQGTVEGNRLTLEAEGPNFMAGGKPTLFRDVYEFKSESEMSITSLMKSEDGKWVTFMNGTARRTP